MHREDVYVCVGLLIAFYDTSLFPRQSPPPAPAIKSGRAAKIEITETSSDLITFYLLDVLVRSWPGLKDRYLMSQDL